jgi:hypothetical protein
MKLLVTPLLLLSLFLSCSSVEQRRIPSSIDVPSTVSQLVAWETQANAVASRSNAIFDLQHYEIPMRLLEHDFTTGLEPKIKDSLVFEKNGETWVRWVINPEDSRWHLEIKNLLESEGIDSTPKNYLKGHLTASRSMIAYNPHNGTSFSIKVSTNKTGGNWTDKKQTWDDAKQIRRISDAMKEIIERMNFQTLVIMDEPLAIGIPNLDQGMIVRSLNDVPQGQTHYLPGFSALHSVEGARIARLNGADDIAEFWRVNYNDQLGKALAEFTASSGVFYDSPHSQNFMIELDQDLKPTGRIVLRDFGDAYAVREIVEQTAHADLLAIWEQGNIRTGKAPQYVGLLHGNQAPEWLSKEKYYGWSESFFENYEKRFAAITNVDIGILNESQLSKGYTGVSGYAGKSYDITQEGFAAYLEFVNCLGGHQTTLSGKDCIEVFMIHQNSNTCSNMLNRLLP